MNALQVFEPGSRAVYTIEVAARMAQVPRRLIVLYYKHGLVAPVTDPAGPGWYFDDEAVRIVRRIKCAAHSEFPWMTTQWKNEKPC